MDQGSRLCIEYRKMYGYGRFRIVSYTFLYEVKADVMECAEGSNPNCDIDVGLLRKSFREIRSSNAAGVDKVTAEDYVENLDANLYNLHDRLCRG